MKNTYNIFYPISSEWEYDFFKNDLFNKHDFYTYDLNFDFSKFKNKLNILIISKSTSIHNKEDEIDIPIFLKKSIDILNPFCIFHLSDEGAKTQKFHNYYLGCKVVFHQYNSSNLIYNPNHYQIPLGYIKGYPTEMKLNKNKKYDFSFVGQLKNDRIEMLNKFKSNFSKSFINIGNTNWNSTKNQRINPTLLYQIYNESLFVPIGRGNNSLDCFRLYECIIAGAIPVIVGTKKEIKETFSYNMPTIITNISWESVINDCKIIINNKQEIENIILSNFDWWSKQVNFIKNKVIELQPSE